MDYARLTDNKGPEGYDFRNMILIMTSNAGTICLRSWHRFQWKRKPWRNVFGTGGRLSKPEFINRLSDMVVFNDMDKHWQS